MLKEQLLEDLKNAMKEKDEIRKNAVQMVRAAILKDSIEDYKNGERQDLVSLIETEIEILSKYLPKQLSKEEIKKIVEEVIKEVEATSIKDMGKVMKVAKEKIGASADGKSINEVVKELLS